MTNSYVTILRINTVLLLLLAVTDLCLAALSCYKGYYELFGFYIILAGVSVYLTLFNLRVRADLAKIKKDEAL